MTQDIKSMLAAEVQAKVELAQQAFPRVEDRIVALASIYSNPALLTKWTNYANDWLVSMGGKYGAASGIFTEQEVSEKINAALAPYLPKNNVIPQQK